MPYTISEIFFALQGEGNRAGSVNVFVRFSGCNLRCVKKDHGFDCDTDFQSVYNRFKTPEDLVVECEKVWGLGYGPKAVILTGGEPSLQINDELIDCFHAAGFYVAVETNGLKELPKGVDWISCSPKTAEHTLRLKQVNELRYVRDIRQGIPKTKIKADYYYLSPAADGGGPKQESLEWCMRLAHENPQWRLSVQMHKLWDIR